VAQCKKPKHKILLSLCYACGLRVSEVLGLQLRNIDGGRKLLHIQQGKSAKDQMVLLGDASLYELRA
jgi:integrase/recombinase XerD